MEKKQIHGACCSCMGKGGIWFIHEAVTMLLFYDFEKRSITFFRVIPCEEILTKASFGAMVMAQEKIYMFSNVQKQSFIYDVKEDRFEEIAIENSCMNAFRGAYVFDNRVHAIPYRYSKVFKISLSNHSKEYSGSWKQIYGNGEELHINSCARVSGKDILMAVPGTNKLLMYDMQANKWSIISSNDGEADYTYACLTNNNIYAYDKKKRSLCMISEKGDVIKEVYVGCSGVRFISFNDYILLSSLEEDELYIYSWELEKKKTYHMRYEKSVFRLEYHCLDWLVSDGFCYGINKANELLIIDKDLEMSEAIISMDDNLYNEMIISVFKGKKSLYKENEVLGLEPFLAHLTTGCCD